MRIVPILVPLLLTLSSTTAAIGRQGASSSIDRGNAKLA
jgi:hypothetical protein